MRHDGESTAAERLGDFGGFAAALQLDGGRAARLEQPGGVAQGGISRRVGHVGQVGDDQRGRDGPGHGGGVMDDIVHAHGQFVLVPEHGAAHAVAHQQGVNASAFGQAGEGGVVGRDADEGVADALARTELWNRHG